MNDQDKSRDELIKELQELNRKYDSLKSTFEKDSTKRKNTEEQLQLSNQRLALHIQHTPLIDPSGT